SRGSGEDRSVYLSCAGFSAAISNCRAAGISATAHRWTGAYWIPYSAELSRHPTERNLPELDFVWHYRPGCSFRELRGRERVSPKFSAVVYTWSIRLHTPGFADCALFHDRVRVGLQSGRRSQPGVQREGLLN